MDSYTQRGVFAGERRTFIAGLVVVALAAAIDLAVGSGPVLVELLVIGPLVAMTGASERQTALVAGVALAAAIPLGAAGGAFGSAEHLSGVIAVALAGILSVLVAHLRSTRDRDGARLRAQYGAVRVLAEADTLEGAAPRLLEAIGAPLGWRLGNLWETGDNGALRRVGSWLAEGVRVPDFERATRHLELPPGQGLPGRVWQTGRAVWLSDLSTEASFPRADAAKRSGIRGAMAFPVLTGDECAAVIEFFGHDARRRDKEMIDLTESLGSQIGGFVLRLRAADALRASEAQKSAVLDSTFDGVITIDHEGRVLEFSAAAGRIFGRSPSDALGREMAEILIPPALRDRHRAGLRRRVEEDTGPLLGRRTELVGMRADGSEFPVELSVNRVPGREPPVFTGVVRDITERKRVESERDELLRLEHLARLDATQARDQLEAILRGVADAVTAQGPDGRLLFANEAAVATLGYPSSDALLAAPLSEVVERFEILDEGGRPFPLANLPGRRAIEEGEGGEAVVRFRRRGDGHERWSAIKSTPIRDGDGSVVMAINVIEDITAHKRSELAQRLLAQSGAMLASSLDPNVLVQNVARLTVPELADWCAVDLRTQDGRIERAGLAHTDPQAVASAEELARRHPIDPDARAGVANVLRTGAAELHAEIPDGLIRDVAVDDEHYRLLKAVGMRSAIIAPLLARERVLGALTLVSADSGRQFDEQDLELARQLALRCAGALDNARLQAERAYIARTLQQSLLPTELPQIPGIDAAARFRPTGEGSEVGGDFYDLFTTGGRGWTIVMGDVCGKGPDAAAVTALARYTLRAAAMRERLPSRSLSVLNEALLRQRDDRRFCTVAYAYLERVTGGARVAFASGGHPLPLLLRRDGTVEAVGAPGTLLGIVPDPRLADRTFSLEPGDALVFYTDGVVEARGADGSLDEDRLAALLASLAGHGADAIAAAVEEAALRSSEGRPRDDMAVMVLRVVA